MDCGLSIRYNFNGAYAYVQMVRPAASNTGADSMFTIGYT